MGLSVLDKLRRISQVCVQLKSMSRVENRENIVVAIKELFSSELEFAMNDLMKSNLPRI